MQSQLHPCCFSKDSDICVDRNSIKYSSSQKLLAPCNKHPRSSLHVDDERNQSIQPATKEGSPSCLERGHVSQLQRGSAAATSLWNVKMWWWESSPWQHRKRWQWRLENESGEIWACQRGERQSTAEQGRRSPWLTSSLTLPTEPVEGWDGGWGTRLRLEAYLPSTRSPHLFQLPGTINTNIPTSISAFQGRKALMRIYCPVVVTVWTPRDAGGTVHLHTP